MHHENGKQVGERASEQRRQVPGSEGRAFAIPRDRFRLMKSISSPQLATSLYRSLLDYSPEGLISMPTTEGDDGSSQCLLQQGEAN